MATVPPAVAVVVVLVVGALVVRLRTRLPASLGRLPMLLLRGVLLLVLVGGSRACHRGQGSWRVHPKLMGWVH